MVKRKQIVNPKKNWAALLRNADRKARARATKQKAAIASAFKGYTFYVGKAASTYLRGPKGRFAGRAKSR
jgi:hypothetical protein